MLSDQYGTSITGPRGSRASVEYAAGSGGASRVRNGARYTSATASVSRIAKAALAGRRRMLRPYGDAVGFDLTRIGPEFARSHGHRVAQASISHIPFKSGTFDLVTSFDVFQTLPDDVERMGIAEMLRVVKPGGWLLLHA